MRHTFMTDAIRSKLMKNASIMAESETGDEDFAPVVKYFFPLSSATWLLSEMDEDGICFGLCDLGMGTPELGSVALSDLSDYMHESGVGIERDVHWQPKKGTKMSDYAQAARNARQIVDL